jgi:hypothetical protein
MPASNPRICVVILGMHRSGTSAATRMLNLLGAELPKELIGSGPGNEAGHWEPKRIVSLNDDLLSDLGSSWDDWGALDFSKLPPERLAEYKSELGRLLREDCGAFSIFALKDPRMCRLLPLVREVAGAENIDLRAAVVFRNPVEVVDSLERRKESWAAGYTRVDAALLWLRHVLDAEATSRDMARVTVSYDSLLADWRTYAGKLIDGLRLPLPPPSQEAASNIDAFLLPSRQHHQRTTDDVRLDVTMKHWVAEAYEAMQALEAEPHAVTAVRTLDRVRSEFEAASPVTKLLLNEARAHHNREAGASSAKLASRESEASALRERVVALEEEAKALRDHVAGLGTAPFGWRLFAGWGLRTAQKLISDGNAPNS